MDRIHENAQNIVDLLLENEAPVAAPAQQTTRQSCGKCERQFGVHAPNTSHGNCKRHQIEYYQQTAQLNPGAAPKMQQMIAQAEAQPDSAFPPDLAKPENEQLRNSMEKKDFETNDRRTKIYLDQFHRLRGEKPI